MNLENLKLNIKNAFGFLTVVPVKYYLLILAAIVLLFFLVQSFCSNRAQKKYEEKQTAANTNVSNIEQQTIQPSLTNANTASDASKALQKQIEKTEDDVKVLSDRQEIITRNSNAAQKEVTDYADKTKAEIKIQTGETNAQRESEVYEAEPKTEVRQTRKMTPKFQKRIEEILKTDKGNY